MSLIVSPRVVKLTTRTEVDIKRNLPHQTLRRIGAWVFLDHFGPTKQVDGMVVAAHPHSGLQTVTWPFAGMVEHRDSTGVIQMLRPGQLNLMTAGSGISHSEQSQVGTDSLHAAQLWIALPDSVRHMAAEFEHLSDLPVLHLDGGSVATVFIGTLGRVSSPAKVFTPLVGAELQIKGSLELPLDASFEHGILAVNGNLFVNGHRLETDQLIYLEPGERAVVTSETGATALLIGGEPFDEKLVMWWNFIGRDHDEIVAWRESWNAASVEWPAFVDEIGGRIPAPELPNVRMRPRL